MKNPSRYREDTVKTVLKRAMELDQEHGDSISRNDLQEIGAELGISRAAVERAMLEVDAQTSEVAPRFALSRNGPRLPASVVAFLTGSVLALGFRLSLGEGSDGLLAYAALLVALCGPVATAPWFKGVAKHERFQLANMAGWIGFALPLAWISGPGLGPMLEGFAPYAVMTAIGGSTVIAVRSFVDRFGGASSPGATGKSTAFSTRFIRAVRAAVHAWRNDALFRQRLA